MCVTTTGMHSWVIVRREGLRVMDHQLFIGQQEVNWIPLLISSLDALWQAFRWVGSYFAVLRMRRIKKNNALQLLRGLISKCLARFNSRFNYMIARFRFWDRRDTPLYCGLVASVMCVSVRIWTMEWACVTWDCHGAECWFTTYVTFLFFNLCKKVYWLISCWVKSYLLEASVLCECFR